jgi:2-methylcitrate dehydratase PrpD
VLTVDSPAGRRTSHVVEAKGHPGNPMDWDDMRRKFHGLVGERLGTQAASLFEAVRAMGSGATLPAISTAVARMMAQTH